MDQQTPPKAGYSPPPIKVTKRARADTRVLLGDKFQETVTDIVLPPKPERRLDDYTDERVRIALKYADSTLRNVTRKLSPLGERAVLLYKEACVKYLELDIEEGEILDHEEVETMRQTWIATIRTYEESAAFYGFMHSLGSSSAQELQDKVLQLKRIG